MGCYGGTLKNTFSYLEKTGIVTDTCLPYISGDGTSYKCPLNVCTINETWIKH